MINPIRESARQFLAQLRAPEGRNRLINNAGIVTSISLSILLLGTRIQESSNGSMRIPFRK